MLVQTHVILTFNIFVLNLAKLRYLFGKIRNMCSLLDGHIIFEKVTMWDDHIGKWKIDKYQVETCKFTNKMKSLRERETRFSKTLHKLHLPYFTKVPNTPIFSQHNLSYPSFPMRVPFFPSYYVHNNILTHPIESSMKFSLIFDDFSNVWICTLLINNQVTKKFSFFFLV